MANSAGFYLGLWKENFYSSLSVIHARYCCMFILTSPVLFPVTLILPILSLPSTCTQQFCYFSSSALPNPLTSVSLDPYICTPPVMSFIHGVAKHFGSLQRRPIPKPISILLRHHFYCHLLPHCLCRSQFYP